MIKKFSLLILTSSVLSFISLSANAADDSYELYTIETIEGDGSFPSLFVDWGFSICGVNKNKELNTGFWGSRFLDVSLCYNLVIPDSHFAIGVGIGYSGRTLSFKKSDDEYHTLIRNKTERHTESALAKDTLAAKEDKGSEYIPSPKGSYLNLHYLGFILDMRFFVNKLYPKDSFICSIGTKIGTLVGSNTEIEYGQDRSTKNQTISDKLNLKDVQWGFQARAAWGRFGVVYEILIPDLFSRNSGPKIGVMQKVGLAIDLF